jgi:hypothetical protein
VTFGRRLAYLGILAVVAIATAVVTYYPLL